MTEGTESTERAQTTDAVEVMGPQTYAVGLLYREAPELRPDVLLKALKAIDPVIEPYDESRCAYLNLNYRAAKTEGNPGAIVFAGHVESVDEEMLQQAVRQTHDWPGAAEAASEGRKVVAVSDILGNVLQRSDRLANLQTMIAAVIKEYPPLGIHWPSSQKIVAPQDALATLVDDGLSSLFAGAVNVRTFSDPDAPGEFIFDTMGLAVFGIADIQCHFHTLDGAQVANLLFNLAEYLFQNGNVIKDGDTIPGPDGKNWPCKVEWSLVPPRRPVLVIDPGEFAAPRNSARTDNP